MVLLATFNLLLRRQTGLTDLTVPTITSGRGEVDFHETVGPFFNMVPLRTDVTGARTFRDLVQQTRATCLEAYSYEIPFGEIMTAAPEIMAPYAEDHLAVVAFQAFQFPAAVDGVIGDLGFSEIRRRLLSHPSTSDIPNGVLWALDVLPSGETVGSLRYNSKEFNEATLTALVSEFRLLLRSAVTAPDATL
jgi:condensation enzyme